MSNRSKRHRTNFTSSQRRKIAKRMFDIVDRVYLEFLDKQMFKLMTEGFKSSYTESPGSEDVQRKVS